MFPQQGLIPLTDFANSAWKAMSTLWGAACNKNASYRMGTAGLALRENTITLGYALRTSSPTA